MTVCRTATANTYEEFTLNWTVRDFLVHRLGRGHTRQVYAVISIRRGLATARAKKSANKTSASTLKMLSNNFYGQLVTVFNSGHPVLAR